MAERAVDVPCEEAVAYEVEDQDCGVEDEAEERGEEEASVEDCGEEEGEEREERCAEDLVHPAC